jgi:hypothetical protein
MPIVIVVAAAYGLIFFALDVPSGEISGRDGISSNVMSGSQTKIEHVDL